MPAYIVSIRHATKDHAALAEYGRRAPAAGSAAGRTFKRLATSAGMFRALRGSAEGLSILEFATTAAAEDWFDSPEYQAALQFLIKGADYSIFLIEGETEIFAPVIISTSE
jgi:uncharacterized protein (DUF1330 family)